MKIHVILLMMVSFLLYGCSIQDLELNQSKFNNNLIYQDYDFKLNLGDFNHVAGKNMVKQIHTQEYDDKKPILVASFVDINDLNSTSPFGRVVSQQLATPFVQAGFTLKELLLRKHFIIVKEKKGEFMLSRNFNDIIKDHNAQAVLVGTYAQAGDIIYLNSKLVDAVNGKILAAYDYSIPNNKDVKYLLRKDTARQFDVVLE